MIVKYHVLVCSQRDRVELFDTFENCMKYILEIHHPVHHPVNLIVSQQNSSCPCIVTAILSDKTEIEYKIFERDIDTDA